jgi:Diacylglycerol kinase accessory domain
MRCYQVLHWLQHQQDWRTAKDACCFSPDCAAPSISVLQAERSGFSKPAFNDSLVEVVGFTSGYHAGAVLFRTMPCVRLAQAAGARIRVTAVRAEGLHASVYMQLDGEPWKQDVPAAEGQDLEVRATSVISLLHCCCKCQSSMQFALQDRLRNRCTLASVP